MPSGRGAEAKPSHCAWHLGCFCMCGEVAERECALQGQGLAGDPQNDAKERHSCLAACSSPRGPRSEQAWGNDEKYPHIWNCSMQELQEAEGLRIWGCLTHCHREGKSLDIHLPCFIATDQQR